MDKKKTPETVTASTNNGMRIRVKYEELSAKFANQVIINSTNEEIYLDFSSGAISDPGSGESTVPIHTRIAMTPGGVRRLIQALQQSVARIEKGPGAPPAPAAEGGRASLPKLEVK